MSYNLYQVSNEGKVITFCQNQKAPNKVGETLCQKVKDLLIEGRNFQEVSGIINQMHSNYQERKQRGIDSVQLSIKEHLNSPIQPHKSLYLSYKLNGTFCTFTEYQHLK